MNRPYFVHKETDPVVLKYVQDVEKGTIVDPDLPVVEASHLLDQAETDRTTPLRHPEVLNKEVLEEYKDQIRGLY
jgi:hypothetical protein